MYNVYIHRDAKVWARLKDFKSAVEFAKCWHSRHDMKPHIKKASK